MVDVDIIDLRGTRASSGNDVAMRNEILNGLRLPVGHNTLPTMLLYDERGLRLYDAITTDAFEYYPFAAEEEILKEHADDIVRFMHSGMGNKVVNEAIVELGAG